MSNAVASSNLAERVAEILAQTPGEMTIMMARKLGVPEAEVIRNHPAHLATELDATKSIEIIKALEALGKVHVIASNEGCTLEAYGHFGGFSLTGPFFNVQTPTLDMHIRHPALTQAFALIKPSHQDGQTTYSVQFYTPSGTSAFKVFLYKSVTEADSGDVANAIAAWESIRDRFRKG